MNIRAISLVFLFFIYQNSRAQEEVADTLRLDDLVIHGLSWEKYSGGYNLVTFDSGSMINSRHLSIQDFISQNSPVFFKSYGNGMASSISIRGTGPAHTAVYWNGLSINQPTLGQTDFSLIPVVIADKIELQYGASSALFGSEALGGTVLINTNILRAPGKHLVLSQDMNSYGQSYTSGEFSLAGGKTAFSTRLYFNNNPNRFTFQNITKPGSPEEQQENASVIQGGVMQDAGIRINRFQQLTASGWFNSCRRELQPLMPVTNSSDHLENKNTWITLDYRFAYPGWNSTIKTGYLMDYYLYNSSEKTVTRQYLVQGEFEKVWSNMFLRGGLKHNYIDASVDSYKDPVEENRTEFFSSLSWFGNSWINASLNIRQQITGNYSPIAPSAGIDIFIIRDFDFEMKLNMLASRSYRIPSLNDRYWYPGGNVNLEPEFSKNIETGLSGKFIAGGVQQSFTAGVYHMRVDNWITWIPSGQYWAPENLREVWASGIETSYGGQYEAGNINCNWKAAYFFTESVNKAATGPNDKSYGKQLPYTPLHNASITFNAGLKLWNFNFSYNLTGERFTTGDNQDVLPAFHLINAGIGKNFIFPFGSLKLSARIDNLTNTSYQVMQFRAMPGRNYGFTIQYVLDK